VSLPGASSPGSTMVLMDVPTAETTVSACPPATDSKRLPCDACGHPMEPEHAHYRCPACGYILPCCGW
jgi:Zn finger protein HypA/HybF involved in hydrogenase expression